MLKVFLFKLGNRLTKAVTEQSFSLKSWSVLDNIVPKAVPVSVRGWPLLSQCEQIQFGQIVGGGGRGGPGSSTSVNSGCSFYSATCFQDVFAWACVGCLHNLAVR